MPPKDSKTEAQVSISDQGQLSPAHIQVTPGDTVVFRPEGVDVVLCVHPSTIFGEGRYVLKNRQKLRLEVQPEASGSFEYATILGNLEAPCKGGRVTTSGEGGGEVSGGPDD